MDNENPVVKAIQIAGSVSELAARCGVRYQAVQRWRRRGQIPAERVLQVQKATSGRITPQEMRPDVFGEPTPASIPEPRDTA